MGVKRGREREEKEGRMVVEDKRDDNQQGMTARQLTAGLEF